VSQGTRPAFQRLAIVNRGEPAMRLINAVREWNARSVPIPTSTTPSGRCARAGPTRLRPYLADAVQRGIARTLTQEDGTTG
jgi:hypothetical protein